MSTPRKEVNGRVGFANSAIRLRVAIVYEDFATGARAKSALEFLLGSEQPEVDVQLEMWRFDLWHDPETSRQVRNELAVVDIVVFSTHGKGTVPGGVLIWLDQWLKMQRASPGALVVSLDEAASDDLSARQMLTSLQSRAATAGVQVFLHLGSGQRNRSGQLTETDVSRQSEPTTPPPDETLNRVEGHSHWGINE
jgi:hypothetical protein